MAVNERPKQSWPTHQETAAVVRYIAAREPDLLSETEKAYKKGARFLYAVSGISRDKGTGKIKFVDPITVHELIKRQKLHLTRERGRQHKENAFRFLMKSFILNQIKAI